MKHKGINPLERHAEKIVLALAAAGFLFVLALQFIGGGAEVNVAGGTRPIGSAYEQVADEAQALLGRIRSEEVAPEAPTEAPELVSTYRQRMNEPVVDRLALASPLGRPLEGEITGATGLEQLAVEIPDLPPPTRPEGVSFAGTIDPLVVAATEGIRDAAPRLPDEQPYDLRGVSVEARFNAADLVDRLERDPDGPNGPIQQIPIFWWQDHMEVLDVRLERQEMYAEGGRGAVETIGSLPGRFSVEERLEEISNRPTLINLVADAREHAREIMTPRWWRMIAGDRWLPPSALKGEGERREQITRLRAQAERLREEISELRESLRGGRDARGRRDAGWMERVVAQRGRPGGQRREGQRETEDRSPQERRRQQLEQQIERRQAELAEVEARLADLGALPREDEAAPDPVAAAYAEPLARLRDANELRLWAHDPSPRPGATYRYRMRLVFSNPLFGLQDNLAEGYRDQAATPMIETPPSEWSAPVSVEQNAYLFLSGARVGETLGVRAERATFELYRFYYGYWRRATRQLNPGDAVTGALDLEPLGLPRFEIEPSDAGALTVVSERTMSGAFSFAADGWFLLDVTPAPTTGDQLANVRRHQCVLRAPDGDLRVMRPGEGAAEGVRSRLAASVEAASQSAVRRPSLNPGEGFGDEERRARREGRRGAEEGRDRR